MLTDKPNRRDLIYSLLPAIVGGQNVPRAASPDAARKVVDEAFAWADAILHAWPTPEHNV